MDKKIRLTPTQIWVLQEMAKDGAYILGSGNRWKINGIPPRHGITKAVIRLMICKFLERRHKENDTVHITDLGRKYLAEMDAKK